jgi:hypothetical protein
MNVGEIARKLGKAKKYGADWWCLCPAHEDKHPSLTLAEGRNGKLLWHCRTGCEQNAVGAALRAKGLLKGASKERSPQFTQPVKSKPERRRGIRQSDFAVWSNAVPLAGTLAEVYLRARHCYLPPADGALRFLPTAKHWLSRTMHPAMIGLVTDSTTNEQLSLHYTFLKSDGTGKAEVEKPKLLLSGHEIRGGCIRLWPDECVTIGLGIAEGIETALAAAHLFRPVWSTIDAGHLAKFPVLDGIESLTIFTDRDRAGTSAASKCANRWRATGREVRCVTPANDLDFNDAAVR